MGIRTIEAYKDAFIALKEQIIDPEAGHARPGLMETIDSIEIHSLYEINFLIQRLELRKNFDSAIALAEKMVNLFKERVRESPDKGRLAERLEWQKNRVANLREEQAEQ